MKSIAELKTIVGNWAAEARANPVFARGIIGAAFVVIADQASKFWIVEIIELPMKRKIELSPIFDLTYTCNRGASFGMLAGGLPSRIFLSVLSIAIASVMVAWLGRLKRRFAAIGASLVIGGAVGNLFDRIRYGCVTDFLDFSGLMFPWIFNIADTAINIGLLCLIIDALTHKDGAARA